MINICINWWRLIAINNIWITFLLSLYFPSRRWHGLDWAETAATAAQCPTTFNFLTCLVVTLLCCAVLAHIYVDAICIKRLPKQQQIHLSIGCTGKKYDLKMFICERFVSSVFCVFFFIIFIFRCKLKPIQNFEWHILRMWRSSLPAAGKS